MKNLAALIFCLLSSSALLQAQNDLGVRFNVNGFDDLALEYRKSLSDKSKLTYTAVYGADNFYLTTSQIESVNPVFMTRTNQLHDLKHVGLKLGFEQKLKWKPLYVGAKLSVNYMTNHVSFNYYSDTITEPTSLQFQPFTNVDFAGARSNFIVPGSVLYIGLDLPINQRLTFTANALCHILIPIHMNTHYYGIVNEYTPTQTSIDLTQEFGFGLRFNLFKGE